MNIRKVKSLYVIIITLAVTFIGPIRVFAVGKIDLLKDEVGSVALAADSGDHDIISVDFPTLQEDEDSPFDFFIDPQNLLFETGASLYGGGVVDEGANLLFHNRTEGKYDFSGESDKLTITNRSTVPVTITITARITDIGDLQMVQNKEIPEDDMPYVYLALVDDKGNEQPISGDGEVSIRVRMERASQNVYSLDSAPDNYEYRLPETPEDISFDTYSFGLTGECSSNADWSNIFVHPKVVITWHGEPVLEEREIKEEDEPVIEKRYPIEEMPRDEKNEEIIDENDEDENIMNEEMTDENDEDENIIKEDKLKEDISKENIPSENTETG